MNIKGIWPTLVLVICLASIPYRAQAAYIVVTDDVYCGNCFEEYACNSCNRCDQWDCEYVYPTRKVNHSATFGTAEYAWVP